MARDFNRCIAALRAAAGRNLTEDEIAAALERVHQTALDIKAGRLDTATPSGSEEHVIRQAAQIEAERMVQEAALKAKRAVMDAQTAQTRLAEIAAMTGAGLNNVEAVRRQLVNAPDGRANQFSLETRVQGISQYLKSKLSDTWLAMGDGILDYFQRPEKARNLISEMRGEDTGDALAKKGAQAWLKTAEEARQWFNERGGKVGKLEDWGLPQHHAQDMVARAAGILEGNKTPDVAANRKAWVDYVLPLMDRTRYEGMDDAALRTFLGHAWNTIATNGAANLEPGQFKGTGARANRHAEERQIHFKDADSMIEYWSKFGDKTLPDILFGHIGSMAKDIGFVEHFGSNPNAMFRMLRDGAEQAAKSKAPQSLDKIDAKLASLDRLYNYAAGITQPVANRSVARTFDVLKNLNIAGKLGSAFWASMIGDKVMFEAMGRVNNLPEFQNWWNELRLLNPANASERRLLRQHGLMLDYMSQSMSRFGEELGSNSLSAKLANGVMRVSGMSAVNEWRRGAWALTAMDAIGHLTQTKDWGQIGPDDMRMLSSYGISEADWKVWQKAQPEDLGHGNKNALTPEAIMQVPDAEIAKLGLEGDPQTIRRDAMVKFLGALTAESHIAIIEPGWSERAMMYGGLQRGNIRDELTRSFWQFKAFPFTQFERILQIGLSRPTTRAKFGYMTALPILQTLTGAMMIQVQEMLGGKDPRPMGDWKFWVASFLKGGTLGIYGDFLFSQSGTTRYGTGPLEAVAGPTIGSAADIATFIAQAPGQAARGEEPRVAAKALNIMKGFVPGQNLWFTKAATDHAIFQNAQEALNPGYLAAMRSRRLKEFGSDWWWQPGEMLPDRAPDLGNALETRP